MAANTLLTFDEVVHGFAMAITQGLGENATQKCLEGFRTGLREIEQEYGPDVLVRLHCKGRSWSIRLGDMTSALKDPM